ncbi:efflux RND transporter periplasmic adaptor subunit [Parahaliea aestuarii]|uniref:Efflux RND transporter periplasmic adaptor subunit n=1 Tax=Parahaliea aestuarii TaxID=1852021 RepID=A0A5C8ZW55_9GAMM|nr:efflux RND transporter periplasmic adaptor subunit [Parahaliea aestuarii]TXS91697.1 efflux RND transporter periplasmic adaptor subunit [Parahaliea aestuarii]
MISRHRSTLSLLVAVLAVSVMVPVSAQNAGVPVTVAEVRRMAILQQVPLTGTVMAQRSSRLSAATSGLVQSLRVDAGSRVEEGDVLLELDPELAALQLDSAEARARQAGNALEDARRRLKEAQVLIPQRSIAESVVRDIESEVQQDQAAREQALADAAYQRAVLARHTLRAPFAGVVSAKLTDLGEWVTPGQAVLDLVAVDAVRMDFPVAEDYLEAIRQGGEVHYSLSTAPQLRYVGQVETAVPVTDPGARTFMLRVLPGDEGPRLMPGMSVSAVLQMPTGRNGLVVPRDATLRYPDGRTVVWTIQRDGDGPTVTENLVQTGLQFDGLVEIRSGLSGDELVVLEGNEALQIGQAVTVRKASASAGGA